ncbi:hypothetical protein A3D71_02820 [Candidatus Kaiserbacteria bacterium RIFCSPHIGHO2_02_FULL_55_20]|uniref:Uncharacterized protein n=1 Tax=Candidatus Kaiserbacteria bacterium RIFCSPHIGHO2_02_FULL_55_20 TaxID=1798497 RepID=A0A1F6DYQ7_9BACT|nr:MAG: hypothetical protein A2680_00160 [Candidatus Kaiserbacteria bacterium RIFCSPHIGHO2_01_FULL_55_37]OGG66565.1 MAG: hypothetical protein A3D71_02820 [Candidatus Kaiserbacteria bacterium RIFCSPHIGHO2_02_FULL_55_20]
MSKRFLTAVRWFCVGATILTFLGVAGITVFEVYVRWTLNQNFSVLGGDGLAGLAILVAAQILGLVWLSRSE